MSIIDELVTDRTAADVERVVYLSSFFGFDPKTSALSWSGTADDLAEWLAGLKGAYNAADLNRVEGAMTYVAERLRGYGHVVTLQPGRTWAETDIPTPAMLAPYLANLATLRGVLPVPADTPGVPPDMEGLTWREANDIEKILADIDRLLTNAAAAFRHCGAAVCGGDGLLIL